MADYDFDCIVIGAGSAGVAMSRRASAHGARVALCEAGSIGGTCVMRGCVPKKLLMYGARYREEFADARGFGYEGADLSFSWPRLLEAKEREVLRLSRVYASLVSESGVRVLAGHARLVDAHTVELERRSHTARHIVIATGSQPVLPSIPGAEHGLSSNEVLQLPQLPGHLTVVGSGYVGVELASMFRGFGSQVTVIVRDDALLSGFDGHLRRGLRNELEKRGVQFAFGTTVTQLDRTERIVVQLHTGERQETDAVLFAIGRMPSTKGLGLEQLGVAMTGRGAVKVNAFSNSSVPSVHAVGDCTDRLNLTPVAIHEGRALADTLFGGAPTHASHAGVPTAVFSDPQVACVGLSEEAARAQGIAIHTYVKSFLPLKSALTGRDARTLMKLVVERSSERVLGIHMLGGDAAEIMQGFAVAVHCGVSKSQLDQTVGIHPTAAEELVTMRKEHCGPFEV